jgi:hypothetical protein
LTARLTPSLSQPLSTFLFRHDELALLSTDELSVKISSSEIMELAVALGVTPSASVYWQTHKSIEDALSLIVEDKLAREGARFAALVESEESYLAIIRARAAVASDVLPDSGAPSAISCAAGGGGDRPSSSGVARSRRLSASLRTFASQDDVVATAVVPLAGPDVVALPQPQALPQAQAQRAAADDSRDADAAGNGRVAPAAPKVSNTTLAAIVSPHLPQVIPISRLEEFVHGHAPDAPHADSSAGGGDFEFPSRLAALESLHKIDALLLSSASKNSSGHRLTLVVERENRPEDSLPPLAADAAELSSAAAALRAAAESRSPLQGTAAPPPRASPPAAAAARVTASSTRPAFPASNTALLKNLGSAGPRAFSAPRNAEPFLRALGLQKHIVPLGVGERPPEPPKVGEGFWPPDLFKPETFEVAQGDPNYVRALGQLAALRDAQARRKRDEDIDTTYYPKR